MNAAISVDAISPIEAQNAVARAISGYRTRLDMSLAHANCLGMLAHTLDPDTQIFLKSCLIALRRKLSFGAFLDSSIPPHGVTAAAALHRDAAESISLANENAPVVEVHLGRLGDRAQGM